MSDFFSQINGFNTKAMHNISDNQDIDDEDFSAVDFCIGETETPETAYAAYDNDFGVFDLIGDSDEYANDEFLSSDDD